MRNTDSFLYAGVIALVAVVAVAWGKRAAAAAKEAPKGTAAGDTNIPAFLAYQGSPDVALNADYWKQFQTTPLYSALLADSENRLAERNQAFSAATNGSDGGWYVG